MEEEGLLFLFLVLGAHFLLYYVILIVEDYVLKDTALLPCVLTL